jgi:hypothetical protein
VTRAIAVNEESEESGESGETRETRETRAKQANMGNEAIRVTAANLVLVALLARRVHKVLQAELLPKILLASKPSSLRRSYPSLDFQHSMMMLHMTCVA